MTRPPWLIIGSTATYHWYGTPARIPLDVDLLTPARCSGVGVIDAQWHDVAEELLKLNQDPVFMDPNLLLTLKVSHAHWNVKWEKTMFDVNFLQERGAQVHHPSYHKLVKVWTTVHGKKNVNMAKPMTEFFVDAVSRIYDHEKLHELVAFESRPLHETLREDHSTAWCSEQRFIDMSDDRRALVALEEILATAIERGRLTTRSKTSEKLIAVSRAHKQLVTSMTTGWFARHLILYRRDLLHTRRDTWMPKLNTALRALPPSL